ncbi:uncharacterized protein CCOS01_01568, partial [Colletotrichum costaricense]
IPQRIGFSAGQGFQSTFLPGYSDASGVRSHLLLSLSVVSCFYIFPSAIAGEEDNDTNEFTQLKLKKISCQYLPYPRICILQFRGMLATREMLPFATDEMHVGPLSTPHTQLPEATHPDSSGTLPLQLQLRQPSHSVDGILRRAETSRLRPRKPSGLPSGLCR